MGKVFVGDRVGVRAGDANRCQLVVLAVQQEADFFAELDRVQQVADAQADAAGLVDVRWPDAAPGGTEALLLARFIFRTIKALVKRQDQVRGGAHAQTAGVYFSGTELVQLSDQEARVDGHALPNDAQRARMKNTRRDQVNGETSLLVDHGMASVGPAMAADNEIRVTREQVDDFALALVAPMPADDRSY